MSWKVKHILCCERVVLFAIALLFISPALLGQRGQSGRGYWTEDISSNDGISWLGSWIFVGVIAIVYFGFAFSMGYIEERKRGKEKRIRRALESVKAQEKEERERWERALERIKDKEIKEQQNKIIEEVSRKRRFEEEQVFHLSHGHTKILIPNRYCTYSVMKSSRFRIFRKIYDKRVRLVMDGVIHYEDECGEYSEDNEVELEYMRNIEGYGIHFLNISSLIPGNYELNWFYESYETMEEEELSFSFTKE